VKRLLAIGECMIELAPARDDTFAMGFAGDTFNTAWYAQRLAGDGLSVGYLWVMRAAAVSTTALPSFEDEQTHFRDADPAATAKRYQDQGVQVSIVKDGPGNVLIVTPDNHQTHTPEPATQVVDTTAAGDSFNAGYLVARLQGQSEPDAVAQGCALARKVIGARGALVKV